MKNDIKPILLGCEGLSLTNEERDVFARINPFGFILFQRNCCDPEQIQALTYSLRRSTGRDETPIFIDQEGGRVVRLKPPHWSALPAANRIGLIAEHDIDRGLELMRVQALLIATMLRGLGINGNCAPVLDLYIDGASSAIGDRALSWSPEIISQLGRCAVDTYLEAGIYPVIKHLPGHGRVLVDPHFDLPVVEASRETLMQTDFVPFVALKDVPFAMNCHVVYPALDATHPASLSSSIHTDIIRGFIGFQGIIMTDDLAMGALKMPLEQRARMAFEAGADIALYCSGSLDGLEQIEPVLPLMKAETVSRWKRAQSLRGRGEGLPSIDVLNKQLNDLLAAR